MRKETRELYRQVYETWDQSQFIMAIEEASELIQAVCKFWRDPTSEKNVNNLIEEIVDVGIMIEQLEAVLDCSRRVRRIRRRKLRRLKKRLKLVITG